MSDYCKQCCEVMFGLDMGDLRGLCLLGEQALAICEGCGPVIVDEDGRRMDPENWSKE